MTIRGGGNPRTHMVFEPQSRMGPPPPELRHRCAWLHHGQIHWEIYRIQVCRATLRAWLGELASGHLSSAFDPRRKRRLTRPGKACRRARDRQGQVASRWGRMAGDDCQACSWFVSSSPRSAIGDHLLVPTWVSRWPPRTVTVTDGEGELIIVR